MLWVFLHADDEYADAGVLAMKNFSKLGQFFVKG